MKKAASSKPKPDEKSKPAAAKKPDKKAHDVSAELDSHEHDLKPLDDFHDDDIPLRSEFLLDALLTQSFGDLFSGTSNSVDHAASDDLQKELDVIQSVFERESFEYRSAFRELAVLYRQRHPNPDASVDAAMAPSAQAALPPPTPAPPPIPASAAAPAPQARHAAVSSRAPHPAPSAAPHPPAASTHPAASHPAASTHPAASHPAAAPHPPAASTSSVSAPPPPVVVVAPVSVPDPELLELSAVLSASRPADTRPAPEPAPKPALDAALESSPTVLAPAVTRENGARSSAKPPVPTASALTTAKLGTLPGKTGTLTGKTGTLTASTALASKPAFRVNGPSTQTFKPRPEPSPVLLRFEPELVMFKDYEVGRTYEQAVVVRNVSSTGQRVTVVPFALDAPFQLANVKYPHDDGQSLLAPGMCCTATVRFTARGFDASSLPLSVRVGEQWLSCPVVAQRTPPELSLPSALDLGYCFVNKTKSKTFTCVNRGGSSQCHVEIDEGSRGILLVSPTEFAVSKGQSIDLSLSFSPEEPVLYDLQFSLVFESFRNTYVVKASGTYPEFLVTHVDGVEASSSVSAISLDFGSSGPARVARRRTVSVQNLSHVPVAYHWDLYTLTNDAGVVVLQLDTSAFAISGSSGTFNTDETLVFPIDFIPPDLGSTKCCARLVVEDAPSSSAPVLDRAGIPASTTADGKLDLHVIDVELQGTATRVALSVQPPLLLFSGAICINEKYDRSFSVFNPNDLDLDFSWAVADDSVQISPSSGIVSAGLAMEFIASVSVSSPGPFSYEATLSSQFALPVTLQITGQAQGPAVSIRKRFLDFGFVPVGRSSLQEVLVRNLSNVLAEWSLQPATFSKASGEQFEFSPMAGLLQPHESAVVSVSFCPQSVGKHQQTLQLAVPFSSPQTFSLRGFAEHPKVSLSCRFVEIPEMFVGVQSQFTVVVTSHCHFPTHFAWDALDHPAYNVTFNPTIGKLAALQSTSIQVSIVANEPGPLEMILYCACREMSQPLGISVSVPKVSGLILSSNHGSSATVPSSFASLNSEELPLLDFGTVALFSSASHFLWIQNDSTISSNFTLSIQSFPADASSPELLPLDTSTGLLFHDPVKSAKNQSTRVCGFSAVQAGFNNSNVLAPHGMLCIELKGFGNVPGTFQDKLDLQFEGLPLLSFPIRCQFVGSALSILPTFGVAMSAQVPVNASLKWGTIAVHSEVQTRIVRIQNTGPLDLVVGWQLEDVPENATSIPSFQVVSGPMSIAAHSAMDASISFTGTTPGSFAANLVGKPTISDPAFCHLNDDLPPLQLELTASCVLPSLTASKTPCKFTSATKSQQLRLVNTSKATVSFCLTVDGSPGSFGLKQVSLEDSGILRPHHIQDQCQVSPGGSVEVSLEMLVVPPTLQSSTAFLVAHFLGGSEQRFPLVASS
eukprot:TRINITY_DN4519_c0_g1_i1.p1 TRINITY_DN4519_c0_g1~~TRINITY_DN4519_c0_g1_i1.p1  ORF type:complete len:1433 (-),score=100.21 TRINITY_DN4519_c0_g1_i1:71-4324(-)